MSNTASTATLNLGLPDLKLPGASGTSTDPLSTSSEDGQQVGGFNGLFGMNVSQTGSGTVTQGIGWFNKLAKTANGRGPQATAAKASLAQIQQEMYAAGYYGSKKPTLGALSGGGEDEKAFRSMLVDASNSGQKVGDYLTQRAQSSTSAGTAGSPGVAAAPAITEKQTTYTPGDIQSTVNSTAQTLLGRNATPAELQKVADQLNQQSSQATQADVTNSEASAANQQESQKANAGGVDAFLAAIKQHESGGNYTASNARGGASGAYQYIQSTWSSEAKAAGYGQYAGMPAGQAPPAVQDAVARYNALQQFNQYGSWKGAAEAWYYPAWAGDPTKQNSVPVPQAGNKQTIGQYGDAIVAAMGQSTTAVGQGVPASVGIAQGQVGKAASLDPTSHQPPPKQRLGAADQVAIQKASTQQGVNYVWGGESPGSGFDCSGLVQWAYQQAGISLPRVAQDQFNATTKVAKNAAQPGDLVFFGTGSNGVDHVGLYIGNDQMIVAPHTGTKVQIQSGVLERKDLVGVTAVTGDRMTPADWAALSTASKQPGGSAYLAASAQGQNVASTDNANQNNVTITPTPAGANSVEDAAANVFENQESSQFQANNLLNVFDTIHKSMAGTPAGNASVRGTPINMAGQTS